MGKTYTYTVGGHISLRGPSVWSKTTFITGGVVWEGGKGGRFFLSPCTNYANYQQFPKNGASEKTLKLFVLHRKCLFV